ncbi:hypothetical protein GV829_08435 [Sphingomonas lacunae]|uniref:Uncharacterized protein n=1 Tax=Sphingomonas lacunae TaxID=2698828 RepID=A0A6M4AVZ7_9SPHN|nr:hypothetical protein [Sphingomonas lacunae]QJQ32472.1 hypothetical protein GV829_08435 [Sphingomonas lacunae]
MVRRRIMIAVAALVAVACVAGPSGRIAVQTHDMTDPSPHRIEATLGIGKAVLSLLVTWSSRN